MTERRFRRALFAALVLSVAVGAAACGGSNDGNTTGTVDAGASPAKTSYPMTINNCGQKVTFKQAPKRVLILNGISVAEVESFVMLGLQKSIAANAQSYGVSDDPSMPAAIKAISTGGLTMNKNFEVPAEQVLAAKPDLVMSHWTGGFDAKKGLATREQLAAAGINTLVNPVNCAKGKPTATPAEEKVLENQSINSSLEFMLLLGRVFDVQHKAADVVGKLRGRIDAVRTAVQGKPAKKVLIAYPGMAMMNANGLPAVRTGGVYDDVIKVSGGINSFAGRKEEVTRTLNKEQLAAAQVDVLVVGAFSPREKPADEAAKLFAQYPQWAAAKTKTFGTVSDGAFLGPMNAWAVEKLSKVIGSGG